MAFDVTLAPSAIVALVNLTGVLGDITDDPADPDASWLSTVALGWRADSGVIKADSTGSTADGSTV